jgi:hypothetical protein
VLAVIEGARQQRSDVVVPHTGGEGLLGWRLSPRSLVERGLFSVVWALGAALLSLVTEQEF